MSTKGPRTEAQNRRYWAMLTWIAQSARKDGQRMSTKDWHRDMAIRFLGEDELPDGTRVPISTTTLDTGEFAEYLIQIQTYAEERLGLKETV